MNLAELPPLADEDRARADHYAVVARLLRAPPDPALLTQLAAARDAIGGGALGAAWRELCEAAAGCGAAAVREEYERLFIGVGRPEIFLYGSYYRAGFLMEEPLAELRDDLAAFGLARRPGVAEPEDHAAALAETLRHLIAGGVPLERQRAFYRRHLEPWTERLAAALEAAAGAAFYPAVGRYLRAFFAIESEAFAMS